MDTSMCAKCSMTDHMWNHVDDGLWDGCIRLEIMYADDRTWTCCSCDLHWTKNLGVDEMPVYFREDLNAEG
jgi:hypothetical protein